MKPDYYIHAHTRKFKKEVDETGKIERVKQRVGEHVMSYRVWKTLRPHHVERMIGPLAKDVK